MTLGGVNHDVAGRHRRRFGTILVARPQTQRPSGKHSLSNERCLLPNNATNEPVELEVLLREHCHKMRILSSPTKLSGAHMVFEKGVALRIYYPNDLERLDQQEDGVDSILEFCMAFQWPIVFFIIPNPAEAFQTGSFVERTMMQSFVAPVPTKKAPPRLCVFSDTKQVLDAFFTFADDVTNTERRSKRSQIMKQLHQNASADQGCVATAIRRLLAPPRCPVGEADVVLCQFDNLQDIINANEQQLERLPIERRTKAILREFFGGPTDNSFWRPNALDEHAEVQDSNSSPISVIQPEHVFVGSSQYEAGPSHSWHNMRDPPLQPTTLSHWSEAPPTQSYAPVNSSRIAMLEQRRHDPRIIRNRADGPRNYFP